MKTSLADRFWQKTEKQGDCLVWTATKNSNGYGRFGVNGKNRYAHRVAWELANKQSIPDRKIIMHSCDNPPCVNPAHLSVGSYDENMKDCLEKGRFVMLSGESHRTVKLSLDEVRAIRASDEHHKVLAVQYNVSETNIRAIRKNIIWKDC